MSTELAKKGNLTSQNFPFFLTGLSQKEARFVEEILKKQPAETWENVADRLKISRRSLYSIRCRPEVRDAMAFLSIAALGEAFPEVTRALTQKALSGDIAAIKVYLDLLQPANLFEEKLREIRQKETEIVQCILAAFRECPSDIQMHVIAVLKEKMGALE